MSVYKVFLVIILAFFTFEFTASKCAVAEAVNIEPVERAFTVKANARLYKGPSAQTQKVGLVRKGELVWILGKEAGTDWYLLDEEGKRGYVHGSLLKKTSIDRCIQFSAEKQFRRILKEMDLD